MRGRLQPAGSVKEVESSSNGIRDVLVDGFVNAGDPLLHVEAKGLLGFHQDRTKSSVELEASALEAIIASAGEPSRFPSLPSLPPYRM